MPEDATISLRGPNATIATVAVEERQSISPRGVLDLLPQVQTARRMGAHLPLLIVAPWISKRTQELLAEQDLNYIDLTGNALLRIDNPPFFLQTAGSARNPGRTSASSRIRRAALAPRSWARPRSLGAGAQAIYLRTGPAGLAISEHTTDGDLALDPEALADSPALGELNLPYSCLSSSSRSHRPYGYDPGFVKEILLYPGDTYALDFSRQWEAAGESGGLANGRTDTARVPSAPGAKLVECEQMFDVTFAPYTGRNGLLAKLIKLRKS